MKSVVHDSARQFARAIIMPNLKPPVTTVEMALSYRSEILQCLGEGYNFDPLMTLYLTDNTSKDDILAVSLNEHLHGIKYYPAGATTNSDMGVTDIELVYPVLEKMAELGVPLLIHGEVTNPEVDSFDREQVFIDRVLTPLVDRFSDLKLVIEHITTQEAVQFVLQSSDNVAATITPHHLMFNRNDMLVGGIRPHYYCLPVLKRNTHQEALQAAAISGNSKFFLGTDSAPHSTDSKENSCGCAGIYSAHAAVEFYTEIFEQLNALEKLEPFASHFGADFYRMPRNKDTITLHKKSWDIPAKIPLGTGTLTPLRAAESVAWQVIDSGADV